MGVDLDVIFPATLTAEETFALPEQWNTTVAVAAACRAYYQRRKPGLPGLELQRWHWDEHRPAITGPSSIADAWKHPHWGEVLVVGTPGLFYIRPNQIRHTATRLSMFAADQDGCQEVTRQVCRAIAQAVGADRVLYLPDSGDWPSEIGDLFDARFHEALDRLAAWGPPVSEIGALAYGRALRNGFHYADGTLRHPDGTAVPEDEINPGSDWIWSAGVTRYRDGRLVPAEQLARPDLRAGFAYYVDDFHDLP